MREQSGNMYPFVTHTWSPVKGRCAHDCKYCYMKRFPQNDIRLDGKSLAENLGTDRFIFVCSGTDLFAKDVPPGWVHSVLAACDTYPKNTYLFQTKNPAEMLKYRFEMQHVLGTTIETNRWDIADAISKAPPVADRARAMANLSGGGHRTMVTIEPVVNFDVDPLVALVRYMQPEWVNIGADSKNSELPEPTSEKLHELIHELSQFTAVKLKSNLERIMGFGLV